MTGHNVEYKVPHYTPVPAPSNDKVDLHLLESKFIQNDGTCDSKFSLMDPATYNAVHDTKTEEIETSRNTLSTNKFFCYTLPEQFQISTDNKTICTNIYSKQHIQQTNMSIKEDKELNNHICHSCYIVPRGRIGFDFPKNYIEYLDDHVVPHKVTKDLEHYDGIPKDENLNERFLQEMTRGTKEWMCSRSFSLDHANSEKNTELEYHSVLCETFDSYKTYDQFIECNNSNNDIDIKNLNVSRTHFERHRNPCEMYTNNYVLDENYTLDADITTESPNHLDQILNKLLNKSYDEINVKLEDDTDILIVEVRETAIMEDARDSNEEVILLEQCQNRRYNYASKSMSVLLDATTPKSILKHSKSCDQFLICYRGNSITRPLGKADRLVSHFTTDVNNRKRELTPSISTRSQSFTQSLNTILCNKQTKSVSFAIDIENIDSPKPFSRGNNRKSKSRKKAKSCCID